jgi:hypothetical protein
LVLPLSLASKTCSYTSGNPHGREKNLKVECHVTHQFLVADSILTAQMMNQHPKYVLDRVQKTTPGSNYGSLTQLNLDGLDQNTSRFPECSIHDSTKFIDLIQHFKYRVSCLLKFREPLNIAFLMICCS